MTTRAAWRGPAGLTFRRCLQVAWLPTLLATLAAAWAAHRWRPVLGEEDAPGAASPWLMLPILVATLLCLVACVAFWPAFALARPGRDQLDRLQRGRLAGCGAAIVGALLAQFVLLVPLSTLFAAGLGAPAAAKVHLALPAPATPVLQPTPTGLRFPVPVHQRFQALWVHPLAAPPIGPLQPTIVEVFADGESLGTIPHGFTETRQAAFLSFAPRSFAHLDLVQRSGTVPLVFPDQTVVLVGADDFPTWVNGLLVSLTAFVPSFLALACACLVGALAAQPTVMATVVILQLVQLAGDVGPFASGVVALLRGQWLPLGDVFSASAASLAVGSFAMIARMLLRAQVRR